MAWHATDFDKNGQEQRFDKEAFARMIIRECAGLADQGDVHQTYNLGEEILKAFGVENNGI